MGEFDLIRWIRDRATRGEAVVVGIGDDCALLRCKPGALALLKTDMLMDGRHFRLGEHQPAEIGWKALAVNLSDIAAMAGVPVAALVAVALPTRTAVTVAHGLLDGMLPLARQFGVSLVGGDTNAWDGPLVVSVALWGETTARGPVLRSGARSGDAILVTGPLGGSLMGRHMRPQPRVSEALALHQAADLHALIDISDGLAADLGHILAESGGLGATLDAAEIPIHADAILLSARDGRPALEHACHDGEDFELCVVLDPADATRLLAPATISTGLTRIGRITSEPGLRLRRADGTIEAIEPRGFDHLRT